MRFGRFGPRTAHTTQLGDYPATLSYLPVPVFRMLRAATRLRDPTFIQRRAQYLNLGLPGPVPYPWILARSFVSSPTDLREVQIMINNIQTRARAAQSTLLVVQMSYT